jgi:hypothetical protein
VIRKKLNGDLFHRPESSRGFQSGLMMQARPTLASRQLETYQQKMAVRQLAVLCLFLTVFRTRNQAGRAPPLHLQVILTAYTTKTRSVSPSDVPDAFVQSP